MCSFENVASSRGGVLIRNAESGLTPARRELPVRGAPDLGPTRLPALSGFSRRSIELFSLKSARIHRIGTAPHFGAEKASNATSVALLLDIMAIIGHYEPIMCRSWALTARTGPKAPARRQITAQSGTAYPIGRRRRCETPTKRIAGPLLPSQLPLRILNTLLSIANMRLHLRSRIALTTRCSGCCPLNSR
jgi:hypothetical protein